VRQEGGAVHAAEGYARSTGKVGVVLVTSGPGATNAVTGLADALMDSIPVVCLTGQVPTHLIGNDAFQEADTTGITRPATKHNYLVKRSEDLARVVHEAFYVARSGRPGPVVICRRTSSLDRRLIPRRRMGIAAIGRAPIRTWRRSGRRWHC
jgi:acetolactate synthase-1/2/3 large subunit